MQDTKHKLSQSEIIDLWLKDLRSEKHIQLTGQLCYGETYCCLGRLCELYNEHVEPIKKQIASTGTYDGRIDYLPQKVREFAGINSSAGDFIEDNEKKSLAYLNDNGYNFKQIADVIESRPEGLFKDIQTETI